MRPGRLDAWPPLPVDVYLRRPAKSLPFPLQRPECRIFSKARYALWHGVRALGLGEGDEVLVPAYHHGSEVEALQRANLTCRFYDVDANLEPRADDLEALLGPRSRALYLTHYLGFPQDAPRWLDWCRERGLLLIEDAAQAWLARIGERPVGSFGDLAIFCVYKTIGVAEGGIVLLAQPPHQPRGHRLEAAQLARRHYAWLIARSSWVATVHARLRGGRATAAGNDHGMDSSDDSPPRLTGFLLSRLLDPDPSAQRRRNYQLLLDHLADRVPRALAKLPEGASPFAFPIDADDKPELLARLQRHGIRALDFWSIPHRSLPSTGFPESARLRQRLVGVPVHQELRVGDLERIVEVVQGDPDRQGPLELQVTTALDALRLEWSTLAERTRNVFATWEWISTWWHHFGGDRELLLTACRSGPELMAILPLYMWSARPLRVLRFLGHGPGDELGPIHAAADQSRVAGAFRSALAQLDWDILLGEQLAGDRHWGRALNARPVSREGNPVLRFGEDGWEGFLATRSSNFREQVRRRPRRLAREHSVRYRLADGSRDPQEELDLLFGLHALRWQGRSPFLADEPFHRSFAATALRRGWLRLWFLEIDGRAVAALYGFRFAGTESYYQAGRDPSWDGYAPGLVLLAHAIRRAAEDGMSEYRLLRGGERYKYRFANVDAGTETIALSQGRVTGAAVRFLPTALTVRRALRTASDRVTAVLRHQDGSALAQPRSSRREEVR